MPQRPFTIVSYGEVLWDLLPTGPVIGGAPFNFACRAASLGDRSVMVSRLGRDERGRDATRCISELGVETSYIQWDEERPTGTVHVTLDAGGIPDYFITPDAAYDRIASSPNLLDLAAEADCICYGMIARRGPESAATLERLLAAFKGRFALLDLNLRKNCWTPESIAASIGGAGMLKLNDHELDIAAGIFAIPAGPIAERTRALLNRTKLTHIVVTLGEGGAFAASRDGQSAYRPGFSVKLVDTVGSGDAFTAGFLHTLLSGGTLADACMFGNALGALVAGQRGATQPTPLASIRAVLREGVPMPPDARFAAPSEYDHGEDGGA